MKEVMKELFPPGVKPIIRWRLAMFAFAVMTLIHICWACGWLGPLNLGGGFAYAGEMKQVTAQVRSINEYLLEQSLFDVRVRQCKATGESRTFYTQKLQDLLLRYRELSGSEYRLPACQEL